MVNALMLLYSIIGNYGIAIILFTILIRLLLYPLTVKQIKGATAMQDFQKSEKWQDVQKKYKDDKQKLQQEQMKLYQEMGINPLASCLPTLLQLPILIGIYQAISRCLAVTPLQMTNLQAELYPFINAAKLIPVNNQFLWFNLSQPEKLYLPFLAFGIPVMAVIVVITTYMQSKLMTPPTQPGDQGAGMTQAMNLYMPFFMGYLALTFNAGLSLYLIVTNVVSIAQYAAMGKLNWEAILPWRKPAPKIAASTSTKSKKPTQKPAQKPAQKALPKAKGKD
jgi:YidC/Oxa1 family membrane protein insertase